jgi:hypothetical protein
MRKQVLLAGAAVGALLLVGGTALAQMGGHGGGSHGARGEESGRTSPGRMHGAGHGMGQGQGMGRGMGGGMHGHMRQDGGMGHGRMGQGGNEERGHSMGPHGFRGQGAGPGPGGHGHTQSLVDPTDVEALKREIGITATQEQAWNEYASSLEETASTVRALREGVDREAVLAMSPADRFEFVKGMREQAEKRREVLKAAAEKLVAVLDEAQKAVAQEVLPGLVEFGRGPMRSAGSGSQPQAEQHRH